MASIETSHEHPTCEEVRVEVAPAVTEEVTPEPEEFAVAIRKLERAVRPRGVLADG